MEERRMHAATTKGTPRERLVARRRLLLRSSLGVLKNTHYVKDGLRNQNRWERDAAEGMFARRAEAERDARRTARGEVRDA